MWILLGIAFLLGVAVGLQIKVPVTGVTFHPTLRPGEWDTSALKTIPNDTEVSFAEPLRNMPVDNLIAKAQDLDTLYPLEDNNI